MSWVVVSVIWKLIFHRNGLLNATFLDPIGIPPKNWLTDLSLAPDAIVMMSVWKELGFFMVIFLAGLQNVRGDLLEAAKNRWRQPIPGLSYDHPAAAATDHSLCVGDRHDHRIAGLHSAVRDDQGRSGRRHPGADADIYETAFVFLDGGKAAAMSVVLFAIIALITLVQFWLYRSRVYD